MIKTGYFFSSFGPVAYLLLLSGIVILALSLERLITMYTLPRIPLTELSRLTKIIKTGSLAEAEKCSASLSKTFKEWTEILLNFPLQIAEDELSLTMTQKRISLQRPLEWLNLFAITSPMLGLLGTIWSMSHSFSMISQSLASDGMNKMITYLSEAMYATAFGIILALISMMFLYFLRQRSEQYLSKCELALNRIYLALAHNALQTKQVTHHD